ncbi:Aste57867_21478 [Aphanomyces stellatus]|uniref:Aste57867_21478 protein n=1 Tax=Aphanomyces stellatus TaxID=120398 RepID=A0A485LJQ4_9STRA|nr:hypothetical protein As57867_021409 [Aphanomyces stellatus]VFT98148.1 Aste57867_21478 [Aphanomyces stellatus]
MEHQTSMKMYWSFASDLWAVTSNLTCIGGLSLVRQSATFAFANVSSKQLMAENLTLASPLTPGFVSFHNTVGPFGNIDILPFFALPPKQFIDPLPQDLCDSPASAFTQVEEAFLGTSFSATSVCYTYFSENVTPDRFMLLFALLGAQHNTSLTFDAITNICAWDSAAEDQCIDIYYLTSLAQQAQVDAVAERVQMMQYILNCTTPALYRYSILNPGDPTWLFFGWCYLYDWVAGKREVVSFEGDLLSLVVLSTSNEPLTYQPDPTEIPVDFSWLVQLSIRYVTALYIVLAAWVAVNTVGVASLELQWFVYVLNDGFSCVTQHFTARYAGKSTAVNMDQSLVCNCGVLQIGHVNVVYFSIGICVASVVGCYLSGTFDGAGRHWTFRRSCCRRRPSTCWTLKIVCVTENYIDKTTALMAGIVLERQRLPL